MIATQKTSSKKYQILHLVTVFYCLSVLICSASAQSRCDTACALDTTCKTGLCVLTKCSDDGSCHEYCLNCAGVETCYATGNTCDYSNTVRLYLNSSNNLKYSFKLLMLSGLLLFLLF